MKEYFTLQICIREFDIAHLISLKGYKLYCQKERSQKNSSLKDYLWFKSQETFSEFDFLFQKVET